MAARVVALDADGLAAIADELRVRFEPEPYQVAGATVWAAQVAAATPHAVRLVIWPSLLRVDLRAERWTIVCRAVARVEIYPGVEVLFRRADGAAVFVTADGRVHATL